MDWREALDELARSKLQSGGVTIEEAMALIEERKVQAVRAADVHTLFMMTGAADVGSRLKAAGVAVGSMTSDII